jgi:hypothetical protein
MYCTNCGSQLTPGATACTACGQPAARFAAAPAIENYLIPAVLVTLCCCLPGGIVAIVYAAQVNSKAAAGDVAGAMEASRKAKLWTWISAGAGIVISIIYAAVMAFMATQQQ